MKNSDLKVFQEAGFHVDLIVHAKDKLDNGSRPEMQLQKKLQSVTKLNNFLPKFKRTTLTLFNLL